MSQTDKIVAMLHKMQRDIRDLQVAPQLGNSSLDGGINNYDPNGNLVGRVGDQFDGTYGYGYFVGPRPPQPTKPVLTPCPGGLTVTWDGNFTPDPDTGAPRYAPMDFTRVEVHVGDESGFYDRSAISLRGTIETPRGGDCQVIPLAIEMKYVVLVARTASGADSIPSEEASAIPGSWVTDEEVAAIQTALDATNASLATTNVELAATFDIANSAQTTANGKGRAWFVPDPPVATSIYDIWFDTDDDNKPYKWSGSAWVAQPLGNAAIGNLDAGKISTGYLAAARILVSSLSGDRIIANTLNADRIVGNSITGDKIMANEIVGAHIRSRQIGADKIIVGSLTADELAANAVTASKLDAYAVTSKVVTSGTYRTGYPGDDRIEIIDEVAYDPYLGYYRSIRDTIRWIRGSDGALVAEARGYMGDIGAYGLHLNSHLELGNVNSTIYQVGRRSVSHSATQIRMGTTTASCDGSGNWAAPIPSLPGTPTVVVAVMGTNSGTYLFIGFCVTGWTGTSVSGKVTYLNNNTSGLINPGSGTTFPIRYYAECAV